MSTKLRPYLLALVLAIIIVLGVLLSYIYLKAPQVSKNQSQSKALSLQKKSTSSTPVYYTNKEGKKWTLDDKADFTVASGPGSPISFLEGKIIPLKVKPGDTQKMRIVISSVNDLKSVRAEIETDHGTTTVELKKTGLIAAKDLNPKLFAYRLNNKNEIEILNKEQSLAYRNDVIKAESGTPVPGVSSALAANGQKEVWEASWLVKDTSLRSYHTTFIATDKQGQTNRLVLAWSDPPGWPVSASSYTVSNNASISSNYGVDGGNLTIDNNVNVNLLSGGTLYFNPGKHISIPAGSGVFSLPGQILMNPGASMKKAYIYYTDADQDGYAAYGPGGLPLVTPSTTQDGSSNHYFANIGGIWRRRGLATASSSSVVTSNSIDGKSGVNVALSNPEKTIARRRRDEDDRPALLRLLIPEAHALPACDFIAEDGGDCWYYPTPTYSNSVKWINDGLEAKVISNTNGYTSQFRRFTGFDLSAIPVFSHIDGISVVVTGRRNKTTHGAVIKARLIVKDKSGHWYSTTNSAVSSIDSSWTTKNHEVTLSNTATNTWSIHFDTKTTGGAPGEIYDPSKFGVDIWVYLPATNNEKYTQFNIRSVKLKVGYTIPALPNPYSHEVDCADGDARANPGAKAWFSDPIVGTYQNILGGTTPTSGKYYYDYNCDGVNSHSDTSNIGHCTTVARKNLDGFLTSLFGFIKPALALPYNGIPNAVPGWRNKAPDCGVAADYLYYCQGSTPHYAEVVMGCK